MDATERSAGVSAGSAARAATPHQLRLWHLWYAGEFAFREPFTTGDPYNDRLDAATIAALERLWDAAREAANG